MKSFEFKFIEEECEVTHYINSQCWFYTRFSSKIFLESICFLHGTEVRGISGEKLLLHHIIRIMVASIESNFTLNCIPWNLHAARLCEAQNAISLKILSSRFSKFSRGFSVSLFGERLYVNYAKSFTVRAWFNSVQLTEFRRGDKITFCWEQIKLKINFDNAFHLAFLQLFLFGCAGSFLLAVNFKPRFLQILLAFESCIHCLKQTQSSAQIFAQ